MRPIHNPKYSMAAVVGAANSFFRIAPSWGSKPKRKPSPRKLEPHEVVAKLKARTVAPKLTEKAARLLSANHCLVQS